MCSNHMRSTTLSFLPLTVTPTTPRAFYQAFSLMIITAAMDVLKACPPQVLVQRHILSRFVYSTVRTSHSPTRLFTPFQLLQPHLLLLLLHPIFTLTPPLPPTPIPSPPHGLLLAQSSVAYLHSLPSSPTIACLTPSV